LAAREDGAGSIDRDAVTLPVRDDPQAEAASRLRRSGPEQGGDGDLLQIRANHTPSRTGATGVPARIRPAYQRRRSSRMRGDHIHTTNA
jgi:hypothetical protein